MSQSIQVLPNRPYANWTLKEKGQAAFTAFDALHAAAHAVATLSVLDNESPTTTLKTPPKATAFAVEGVRNFRGPVQKVGGAVWIAAGERGFWVEAATGGMSRWDPVDGTVRHDSDQALYSNRIIVSIALHLAPSKWSISASLRSTA